MWQVLLGYVLICSITKEFCERGNDSHFADKEQSHPELPSILEDLNPDR